MDFKDQIRQLGDRIEKMKDQIGTEEATKNAFIMPFIQCLGYDVFNPFEVIPEYTADLGLKKGEKIDYAIFKDGNVIILIECKNWSQKLEIHDNQLTRYFHAEKKKASPNGVFGVLTNGIKYKFYTDLVSPNMMDEKPFIEFDIQDIKENQIEELKKFHKSYFDINTIISSASDLKYTNELKTLINNELKSPSEEFIRYFAKQVLPKQKSITQNVLFQFTELMKKSTNQVINDIINERLKNVMEQEQQETADVIIAEVEEKSKEKQVETTQDEIEAYFIVKSILRSMTESSRIVHRDAQSYFSILLDDNNRKSICRLYLNGSKKYIGLWDASKKEVRTEIQTLDDIYLYTDQLKATLETYLSMK